ncbi:MAG: hypothetical protein QOG55_974, partial [Acidobacteriaceae bacterium]|nr:hypothetical protein [Acidobacteriaceae bacterium]
GLVKLFSHIFVNGAKLGFGMCEHFEIIPF